MNPDCFWASHTTLMAVRGGGERYAPTQQAKQEVTHILFGERNVPEPCARIPGLGPGACPETGASLLPTPGALPHRCCFLTASHLAGAEVVCRMAWGNPMSDDPPPNEPALWGGSHLGGNCRIEAEDSVGLNVFMLQRGFVQWDKKL